MAATFEWHVEFLRSDPNDDNFIKFITCGIYGTENGVTKKTLWRVPFDGKKSDIPVEDWKNYSDLMEGSGDTAQLFSDSGLRSFEYEMTGKTSEALNIGKSVGEKLLKLAGSEFKKK